ncbi:MAG: hypothetical protein JXX28_07875 [Deltaproteobacteria bacterium]|nr:hypothetical protein [Deltaproteobacteria bacterium]
MLFRFRDLLVSLLVTVSLGTVAGVAWTSHHSATVVVEDLSGRVLDQATGRVQERVEALLDEATRLGDDWALRLEGRPLDSAALDALEQEFVRDLLVHPRFTYVSLSTAGGDYSGARRVSASQIELRRQRRMPDGQVSRVDRYLEEGRWSAPVTGVDDYDPRLRPFWGVAERAGEAAWTPVYLFVNKPWGEFPGVTRAVPIYDDQHALTGVLTVDFDLVDLSHFLGQIAPFDEGLTVLLDREGQLVAHPDPSVLVGERDGSSALLPLDEVPDPLARALATAVHGGTPREGDAALSLLGEPFVAAWAPVDGDGIGWTIATTLPERVLMSPVRRSSRQAGWIALLSSTLAILAGVFVARRLSLSLGQVVRDARQVARYHLDPSPPSSSVIQEVVALNRSVEEMKAGLRSFRKFVPADLVRETLADGQEAVLGGEPRELTIYFSDIVGFATLSEPLPPDELVALLGEYLKLSTDEITAWDGTVDKFIGDAVMAFWGAPRLLEDHALRACRAALANQTLLAALRERLERQGLPPLRARIGLHTGEVLVGNIGSPTRMNYTVIGDAVNLASRVEGLNKRYGTEILITEATWRLVQDQVEVRPLERVAVKGRREGVLVLELLGERGEVDEERLEIAALHLRGLEHYHRGDWELAAQRFEAILERVPSDRPAAVLLSACRRLALEPPDEPWEGVVRMTTK